MFPILLNMNMNSYVLPFKCIYSPLLECQYKIMHASFVRSVAKIQLVSDNQVFGEFIRS